MHLAYPAVLSALLFCTGLYGVLARRNAILVLMSVELMLNAVNLNLVAFDVWLSRAAEETLHSGQALTLFTIAIAAAEIGIGLAIVLAVHRNRGTSDIDKLRDTAELTPTGSVPVELALHIDGFAALVAVLVGTVATCVQIYSTGYLRDDPRYASYAALVSLFTSAMFLVVYSGDLMVLLVGWEVMGICSYFLVGHYWETPEARAASLKAFLVTKLGDVPFLIGLLALVTEAGSFRITKILGAVASGSLDHPTLIALLLLAGVAGKSAQFPLQIGRAHV